MKLVYFQADRQLIQAMKEYSEESEHPILFGRAVTGEQFIADDKRDEINQKFSPLSVEVLRISRQTARRRQPYQRKLLWDLLAAEKNKTVSLHVFLK